MRLLLSLLPLSALLACSDKSSTTDDSGDSTPVDSDSGADDTSVDVTPVWTDVRVETSSTITGAYASGAGFYVVSQGGHSWVRSEGSWTVIPVDTDDEDLNDVWGAGVDDSLEMVTVGDVGIIGTWVSSAWSLEDIGTANLEAIDGVSSSDLIAVGWGGIFRNVSGTWEFVNSATERRFNDVWYDGTVAMGVGEDGDWAFYDGAGWDSDAISSRVSLYGVSGTSASNVWAVGAEGLVIHWTGTAWEEVERPTTASLWGVLATESLTYVVGSNGEAYSWDGTEWTSLPTGVDNILYRVTGAGNGVVWAVGNRGMVLQLQE